MAGVLLVLAELTGVSGVSHTPSWSHDLFIFGVEINGLSSHIFSCLLVFLILSSRILLASFTRPLCTGVTIAGAAPTVKHFVSLLVTCPLFPEVGSASSSLGVFLMAGFILDVCGELVFFFLLAGVVFGSGDFLWIGLTFLVWGVYLRFFLRAGGFGV